MAKTSEPFLSMLMSFCSEGFVLETFQAHKSFAKTLYSRASQKEGS